MPGTSSSVSYITGVAAQSDFGEHVRLAVHQALAEDAADRDVTSRLTLPEGLAAQGKFIAQERMVVAGLPVAAEVFRQLDASVAWSALAQDGAEVGVETVLASVKGRARALLAGERVALNFLQHLSGIATLTGRLKARLAGTRTELLDTRKTTPGLRLLEKYAVRAGGARNHRASLADAILIKNNHVRLAGGVKAAVERARISRSAKGEPIAIEVEVRTISELDDAIGAGAEIVLLDNMTPEQVRKAAERGRDRVRLEVSGGINEENIRAYAEAGVDFISAGALTHSAPAVRIHFLAEPI